MKVNWSIALTEEELRTVRAAQGRGGVATRNDCRIFFDKAVREALKRAPEPKPKRVKLEKGPDPQTRPFVAPENETAHARTQRDSIAAIYGHRRAS